MKRLHLLVLRSFFGPFFLIFTIVLFVLLMQFLWRYIDELVGKGLDFKTIAQFLMYTAATLVPMALPLSILMSALMTFGNLGESYELTAIKASGISLQRIMSPLVFVVILISFGAFFFANNVLPFANLQMRSLLYDIQNQRPELSLNPGEFNSLIDGYSIRIQDRNPKTNTLYNVQIYDHTSNKGNNSIIIADSAYMKMTLDDKDLIMTLFNGHSYNELQDKDVSERKKSYPHRYDEFDEQQIVIQLSGFNLERSDQSLFKNHYDMMNLHQLGQMEDSLKTEINQKEQQIYTSLILGNLFKKHQKTSQTRQHNQVIPEIDTFANRAVLFERKKLSVKNKNRLQTNTEQTPSTTINETLPDTAPENNSLIKSEETAIVKLVNIDSIFNNMSLRDKDRILGTALSFSRTSKNIVENSMQSLDFKIRYLRRFEIAWHRKFTIAFACLIFMFIGAPLGAIIRKGGLGLPLVISVIFFIFYYIMSLTGDKLARESLLPAYQGMWLSSGVFFITGVFLTYQATTDSSMLNLDTYLSYIKKMFGQRFNVVDKLSIQAEIIPENQAKVDKIHASLLNLDELNSQMIESVNINLQLPEFIGSLFALQNDSNLILYERYYNNTFRILINNPVFHKKSVRAKVYDFPSFNYKDFIDENGKLILKVVLACTVLLTPLVVIRQYMQLLLLRAKLRRIKELLPELIVMVKLHEIEN